MPGTLRIEGTPGDDHIVIDASAIDAGSYTVNGQTQPFAGVTKVIVDAGAGNDSVVVNNPTAGLFAPLLGMAVDGGDGPDSVTSQNGVAATGSYASAFGSTPGRLVQVGPAKQVITTVAVENASDFNSDQKFVYKGTPGHDDLWVDDYPSYPLTSLRTIYTRPTNFSFGGKSAVTVDTLGTDSAPDTVKLTGRGQPFSDLAVDDGSQPAEDVITAQDFRFGEAGSGANLRLHGSRIEATPGTSGVDITAGTVALDGGTIGTSGAPLVTDTAGLDALAQGDLRILVKGRFMTSDVQLGGVRKPIGGGVRSTDGSVWLAHEWNGAFTSLAQDAVVSGQSVYLRSDRLDISKGHVNAGAGGVTFQSNNPVPIDLGATTDDYGSFNLSAAEIANVRGPVLSIGQPTSGLVTASDAITRPSTTSLGLISGTGFTATGPGSVSAGQVSLTDGSAGGRSWSVDPSGVSVDGRPPLRYGSTPDLQLNGGSGADAFAIKPSVLTTYAISGGDPTTSPGDSLAYDAGGRSVSGDTTPPDGEVDATGVKPVIFTGIEDVSIANSGP